MSRDGNRKKHGAIHDTCQDVATQEFDMVRSNIFNFHSIISVITSVVML